MRLAFLVFLALAATAAAAQSDRVITGTFTAATTVPGYWTEQASGQVRFERDPTDESGQTYRLTQISATWSASGGTAPCTATGSMSASDSGDDLFGRVFLTTGADTTYTVAAPLPRPIAEAPAVTVTCGDATFQGNPILTSVIASGLATFPVEDGRMNGEAYPPGAAFTWNLRIGPPPSLELVVIPESYETWMPEGNVRSPRAVGNRIRVRAELRSSGGAVPEAESFRFELGDVSREPGVALNWPLPHSDPSHAPDLRITEVTRLVEIDAADGQFAEAGPGTSATATVSAYDFGAWGTVRVTATLADGRTVVGHLEGDPQYRDIRLPRRAPGSFVADRWKEERSLTGQPDAADTDDRPAGDDSAGDGLTLYEEYRGLRIGGIHERLDPRRKDLFVANTIGGQALPGLALFTRLSGLDVHHELIPTTEINVLNLVVNPNHVRGPHLVGQHAVWLRRVSPTPVGGARAAGPDPEAPIGSPADVAFVEVARSAATGVIEPAHVAHELLHTVGVRHHGDGDVGRLTWRAETDASGRPLLDADGEFVVAEHGLVDGGETLDVRRESGVRISPPGIGLTDLATGLTVTETRVWVGWPGQQHSGAEDCVMRYANAEAYPGDGHVRYWTGDDRDKGLGLCLTARGTGINAPGRQPRPRFGDATRGGCAHQIHVSDAR